MPFTLSHPAAVLPFARLLARWRLLSAVVIGSMVPDFGCFLPWQPARFETHSADALITFCLPVGLATYWMFQWLIKWPLIELFPPGAYARWRDFSTPAAVESLKDWVLAACGVLFGAVTHLVWDAFTHEGARGVRMFPTLEDPAVEVGGHRLAGAHLLQDANSVAGLVVVIAISGVWLAPRQARRCGRGAPPDEERAVGLDLRLFRDGRRSERAIFPGAPSCRRDQYPHFLGAEQRRDRRVAGPGRSADRNQRCSQSTVAVAPLPVCLRPAGRVPGRPSRGAYRVSTDRPVRSGARRSARTTTPRTFLGWMQGALAPRR